MKILEEGLKYLKNEGNSGGRFLFTLHHRDNL